MLNTLRSFLFIFLLGALGWALFMPAALEQKQAEFEDYGASDVSSFEQVPR